jgi:hypothetical protein
METIEFIHCLKQDARQALLLGASKYVLQKVFGEPAAIFSYHGKEVLHYGRPGVSFVEVVNGVVTRCEALFNHRASFRVRPSQPTNVKVVTDSRTLSGLLLDVSVSGVAVVFSRNRLFKAREEVELRFAIPVRGAEENLSIRGRFYRTSSEKAEGKTLCKAIFMADSPFGTPTGTILREYIIQRQEEMLAEYRDNCLRVVG